jgi:peptidyl-tRNA hydrolase, PTH1 family
LKLIVGLGNPGRQYRDTRHNVGFAVVDEIAARHGAVFESAPAEAVMTRLRTPSGAVLLAKPLSYMNRSGVPVSALARYFRIPAGEVLVVTDDANLPLGILRVRPSGSDGGHNGLRSIIEYLGSDDFPRLRVGIGRSDSRRDLADYVLARFEESEQAEVRAAIERAADAAERFVVDDIEKVMNAFNRRASPGGEPDPPAGAPGV